jgi:IclR family acetate operon transcriptional repressor
VRAVRETTVGDEPIAGTQTIVRTLAVLRALREAPREVGISELARTLSLHTSTIHRIVRALVAAGYVVQNVENERYCLGREAFLLGRAAERNLGFDAVQPILERLSEYTGESVNLVVRDGEEGLVVLRVESKQPLRFAQSAGARIPLYCTSTGKVLLAFSEDVQAEVAGLGKLKRLTPATITARRALRAELDETRQRGYGVNAGERIPGVCGVAAPVLTKNDVAIAAIAVQGPDIRMPDERIADLAAVLTKAAREVEVVIPAGYPI